MTTRTEHAGKPRQKATSQPVAVEANGNARHPEEETPKPAIPQEKRFFGYKFKDPKLLTLALTHSSLAYETNPDRTAEPGSDNEQLE